MLSTQDRLIYLSFGNGIGNVTSYSGQYLVNNVRDYLKSENYGKAIGTPSPSWRTTHSLTYALCVENIIIELARILRDDVSEEELKAKENAKKKQEKQKIFQKVFFRGFTYLGIRSLTH